MFFHQNLNWQVNKFKKVLFYDSYLLIGHNILEKPLFIIFNSVQNYWTPPGGFSFYETWIDSC